MYILINLPKLALDLLIFFYDKERVKSVVDRSHTRTQLDVL